MLAAEGQGALILVLAPIARRVLPAVQARYAVGVGALLSMALAPPLTSLVFCPAPRGEYFGPVSLGPSTDAISAGAAAAAGSWPWHGAAVLLWLCGMALVAALLRHELVHLRRRDPWEDLGRILLETVLFYHPALWILSATVRRDREHYCDAAVAAETGDGRAYARSLLLAAE